MDLSAGTARHSNGPVDTVQNVQDVTTGAGNDLLVGNELDNRLDGGAGADVIEGGGGADQIVDRNGADTIDSGAGDDRMLSLDFYRDRINCGDGTDAVAGDPGDALAPSCERAAHPRLDLVPPRVRVHGGGVLVPLRCSQEVDALGLITEGLDTCTVQVTLGLRVGGRRIRAGSYRCASEPRCSYRLALNSRARRLLARRSLPGTVTVVRVPVSGALPDVEPVVVVRGR